MTVLPRHEEEALRFLWDRFRNDDPDEVAALASLLAATEERIWERAAKVLEEKAEHTTWYASQVTLECAAAIRAAKEEG